MIEKLNTTKSRISFDWHLLYKCTYRCPYCFYYGKWQNLPDLEEEPSLEKWISAWLQVYEKYGSCNIAITGGEPFLYPFFTKLIKEILKKHNVSITTNLSCSLGRLIDLVNQIDAAGPTRLSMFLSFHPLFAKFEDFLEKALFLKKKDISINILYVTYLPQLKQSKHFKEKFEREGFSFVAVPFRGEYKGNRYPERYTEEEKDIIVSNLSSDLKVGHKRWVESQAVPKKTKGKLCRAGQIYAHIDIYGKVYRCSTSIPKGRPMGSFFDEDLKLLDKPLECEMETCPCESRWLVEESYLSENIENRDI